MALHRFRFFVDVRGSEGDTVELRQADGHHLQVIRAAPGRLIDVVDNSGNLFDAEVVNHETVRLVAHRDQVSTEAPSVTLYADVLTGQRWDALVDGCVQAGVSVIVPVVHSASEQTMMQRRAERIMRVVEAAAKQAKRLLLPEVAEPLAAQSIPTEPAGIILDEQSHTPLVDVVRVLLESTSDQPHQGRVVPLLVGSAKGLDRTVVRHLMAAGWQPASLGPTVMRSELAAAVAVSCTVQSAIGR